MERVTKSISQMSYGIYLCHFMFISFFLKLGIFQQLPLGIEPLCMAVSVLSVCVFLLWFLRKMKLGKIVM